jgi:hypothetical protein
MSQTKQKSITVMREAFQSIVDRFDPDSERLALFTTFNFVPHFFETNILPLLVGDAVDLKGVSEMRHAINEELKKVRCAVVCDRSTRPDPKGDLRYGLLPVGLPHGRFHPKIMLMAGMLKSSGQPGLWLFVGSGNLSLSGWAVNREIVGATPVARQHALELIPLLRWILAQAEDQLDTASELQEEGGVRKMLSELLLRLQDQDQLHGDYPGMPALHLALPFVQRGDLLDRLAAGQAWRKVTVVSPYWSGVAQLVEQLGVAECEFVPSLTPAGTYAFPVSTLVEPSSCSYTFGKFKEDEDGQYTHAKALLLEQMDGRQVLCVGSANFTSAAMRNSAAPALANVEAVLRYELPLTAKPWAQFVMLDRSQLDDTSGKQEEEQPPPLLPFDAAVYCDWQARAFGGHLTILDSEMADHIVLEVAGVVHSFTLQPGVRHTLPAIPFSGNRPCRSFTVRWRNPGGVQSSYYGLVTQVNAQDDQLQYEPRPRLDKVLELLRSLNSDFSEEDLRTRAARGRGEGGGDGEQDEGEASFDYFGLFQGTWKLRDYYARLQAAGKPVSPFDATSPYSVTTLYRAITLQPALTPEARIGRYIQLAEVSDLLAGFAHAGNIPPEGSPCRDIGAEMDALRAPIREALAKSKAFGNMFGSHAQQNVDIFLDWFHIEMKQNEMMQNEGMHA